MRLSLHKLDHAQTRCVAQGEADAIAAVLRLYGPLRRIDQGDDYEPHRRRYGYYTPEGAFSCLTVEPAYDERSTFEMYLEGRRSKRLAAMDDGAREREFWLAPVREAVRAGTVPAPFPRSGCMPFTPCEMCGREDARTKHGAQFCGRCETPPELRRDTLLDEAWYAEHLAAKETPAHE